MDIITKILSDINSRHEYYVEKYSKKKDFNLENISDALYSFLNDKKDNMDIVISVMASYSAVYAVFKNMEAGYKRALLLHLLHDVMFDAQKNKPTLACTAGCSHCCYFPVSVCKDELDLIENLVVKNNIEIDSNLIEKQRTLSENWDDWKSLEKADRKCIFLQNGNCSIYADRPLTCRSFMSSKPEDCESNVNTGGRYVSIPLEILSSVAPNLPDNKLKYFLSRELYNRTNYICESLHCPETPCNHCACKP